GVVNNKFGKTINDELSIDIWPIGNSFSGQFCNNCGQKIVHRITLGHIGHDMIHAFTHADKGFFHLLLKMFVKPGVVAREYIAEGKRKRYFTPFQYILIVGTIAAFVAANSHFIESTSAVFTEGAGYTARQKLFMEKIQGYQKRYYNFMILLQLPFYALATSLVYRKFRYNFAEHLTLQTFTSAQATVIATMLMLSTFVTGQAGGTMVSVMGFITAGFQMFAFMQFFKEMSVKGFFKALLANILGIMLFIFFVAIGVIIYGVSSGSFSG
ncbi:MAG: DUF3667 domain-containing protein, partial [Chitinophagaceae bacterium]